MKEQTFPGDTILVSKTDLQGKITYANQIFINIAGYTEKELIGKPHSIIRHPDMPKIIFKLLWDTIQNGEEINAYVINQSKNGDYYWVFANVIASLDVQDKTLGYHSTRHKPSKEAIDIIKPLYKKLLEVEKSSGVDASLKVLQSILKEKGVTYDEFILSI